MIWLTVMSDVLYRHKIFNSFWNVYGVGVILGMVFQMYVRYFPVADNLICLVLGICVFLGLYGMVFDDPPNAFGLIFRDRYPRGR